MNLALCLHGRHLLALEVVSSICVPGHVDRAMRSKSSNTEREGERTRELTVTGARGDRVSRAGDESRRLGAGWRLRNLLLHRKQSLGFWDSR